MNMEIIKILFEVSLSIIVYTFLLILALPIIIVVLIIYILVSIASFFVSFLSRILDLISRNKL